MEIFEEVFLDDTSARLDVFASEICDISRSRAANLADDGKILINGIKQKKNAKLKKGDVVKIELPDPQEYDAIPEIISK